MKKVLYTSIILALAFTACEKNTDPVVNPDVNAIRFASVAVPDTKTFYEDNGSSLSTSWISGDEIGVFALAGTQTICANKSYVANAGGKVCGFTPSDQEEIKWVSGGSHDFYACYPRPTAGDDYRQVPISIPAVQTVYASNLYKEFPKYDFLIARMKNIAQSTDSVKLEFSHTLSFIELQLSCDEEAAISQIVLSCEAGESIAFTGGSVNLETGALDISSAQTSESISIEGGFRLSPTEVLKVPVAVTPGHAGKKFKLTASVNGQLIDIAERTVPSSGLEVGKVAIIKSKVVPTVPEAVVNLSENGIANSYYAPMAGTKYCFDVTKKGNGIAKTVGGISYTDEDLALDPKALLVLWYNCVQSSTDWVDMSPVDISSLKLEDGKAYFRTSPEAVSGNVVIVALDKALGYNEVEASNNMITNANILWSWNIIVSENYTPDKDAVTIGDVTIMNRDLGAVISAGSAANNYELASAMGNYYQWGRKDPFPVPASYDYTLPGLIFTPTYTPIPALRRATVSNRGTALENQIFGATMAETGITAPYYTATDTFAQCIDHAVKNPQIYYYQADASETSYYHARWYTTNGFVYRGAWGDATGKAGTDKTIYDPCPYGWKLMSNKDWHVMIDNGQAELSLGDDGKSFTVNGLSFPIHPLLSNTGWRKDINDGTTSGSAQYVCSTGGWFILNTIYSNYPARYGFLKSVSSTAKYVKYNDEYYSQSVSFVNGMPVRCVRE